jgi:hypothetical protein
MIPAPVTPPPMINTSVAIVGVPVSACLSMLVGDMILHPCNGKDFPDLLKPSPKKIWINKRNDHSDVVNLFKYLFK